MNNIKLYNQLSKTIEDFVPQNPENVKIYTCGPTVYSYPHIGNYTSYIYWDLLIRMLTLNGFKVNRVLNLTDVGHLASDADEGEDKLEKGAKKEGKTVWEIAEKYIKIFKDDFRSLNLVEPQKTARATDYIQEDINLVDLLTQRGFTYETSDGIYFDTSKFQKYGEFANLDLDQMRAGARVKFSDEKKNVSDFALWKFIKPGENHAMRWDYLGRPGYPGWHLECSTIIKTELDIPIDIHTGGIDHIPVHHTNEIAQTEAAYDTELAKFWLHCDFITIDGEKISKSLGNTYTLADLKDKEFSPLDFKMWVLQGHYRGRRNFSFDDLQAAKTRRLNWRNRIARLYQEDLKNSSFSQKQALEIVNNNLNSAELMALIDNSTLSLDDWKYVDRLFGLKLVESAPDISDELKEIISKHHNARLEKNYALSDKIREELASKNISILDSADGVIWEYID
ncbi:cysteine--tRNA ligase [Candidatus Saccharibacteria bacterium]|nr:cysteine--tRNA ligase [Candidatus Saccharibacteria bacterium]